MTENGFPLVSKKPPELHNQETSSSGPGNNLSALRLFYFLALYRSHQGEWVFFRRFFYAK
jgi:hypothetical protein